MPLCAEENAPPPPAASAAADVAAVSYGEFEAMRVFKGHTAGIVTAALSFDGKLLATGSVDKTLRLWGTPGATANHVCSDHTKTINKIIYSKLTNTLLTASDDNTAGVWDGATGKRLFTLTGHTAPVTDIAFSPDEKLVLTVAADKTARLWNPADGMQVGNLGEMSGGLRLGRFSPSGIQLLVGGGANDLWLFAVETRQKMLTLTGHTAPVTQALYSPRGRFVASAAEDKTVRLWNPATGDQLFSFAHGDIARMLAFSADGTRLATGDDAGTVRIFDTAKGEMLQEIKGHIGAVTALCFSPDGVIIASGGVDRSIRLVKAADGSLVKSLAEHTDTLRVLEFVASGRDLLSAGDDGVARIWGWLMDTANPFSDFYDAAAAAQATRAEPVKGFGELAHIQGQGELMRSVLWNPTGASFLVLDGSNSPHVYDGKTNADLGPLTGHTGEVLCAAFKADGSAILTGSRDKTARFFPLTGNKPGEAKFTLSGSEGDVQCVAVGPGGNTLLCGSGDTNARIYDQRTGQLLRTLHAHEKPILAVAYGPNNQALTAAADNLVRLWNTKNGDQLMKFKGHSSIVTHCGFSPDQRWVYSAAFDKTVRIWNPDKGLEIRTLEGHTARISAVAYSPDGKWIATGSYDRSIVIWNAATGEKMKTLSGHSGGVLDLSWHPNSNLLASASQDRTIRVWDVNDGSEMLKLAGHTNYVVKCAFSPDGSRLLSAGLDNVVRVWGDGAPPPPAPVPGN